MVLKCIFTGVVFFVLFGEVYLEYKGCRENSFILALSFNGYCQDTELCLKLSNCTTLYGDLIIRHGPSIVNKTTAIKPYFPYLREITGFLVIGLFNEGRFNILPSLTVIRGQQLLGNYALIVYYCIELKEINFSSLTLILHGGVRIERNNKLCYVDSIRWKSIVQDELQNEKFGIVLSHNNPNCDTGCATGQCKVVSGHGNDPYAQHCWGPGSNESDHQCQKFCNTFCGVSGCVEGSTNTCCDKECLGGCAKLNITTIPCYACKHYRIEKTGQCVKKCPDHLYLVNNLTCEEVCPGWNSIIDKNVPQVQEQYSLNGKCVVDCPAGYHKENGSRTCRQCLRPNDCPKVCKVERERIDGVFYNGSIIHLPSDIVKKGIGGCTRIIGSLTIQLIEGTGVIDEYVKQLESIREIKGHLKIHKTTIEEINFFPNLVKLDPAESELLFKKYALAIYDNSNLKRLWTPKNNIKITRGKLFAKSNPQLCPKEIGRLRDHMSHKNGTKIQAKISRHTNGHRTSCDIKRLQMNVTEMKLNLHDLPSDDLPSQCIVALKKCVKVIWNFEIDAHYQNIIFFTIYYRRLAEDEDMKLRVGNDYMDTEKWQSVDVPKGNFLDVSKRNSDVSNDVGEHFKIIADVVPHGRYAFYLKEVALGKNRFSKIHILRISRGIPSQPLGLEASFLSNSSIHIKWREPDEPNGEIVKYQIYWKKVRYSYWEENQSLDWCKRNVKLHGQLKRNILKNTSLTRGNCDANFTCICSSEKEKAIAIKADRDTYSFLKQFKDRFIEAVFKKRSRPNNSNSHSKFKLGTGLNKNSRLKLNSQPKNIKGKRSRYAKNITKPNSEVLGHVFSYTIKNLHYFQDYIFTVCACTEKGDGGGCAKPSARIIATCSSTQASTDSSDTADDLDGDIKVSVENNYYNISWNPPKKPNAIILKYEIHISQNVDDYNEDYNIIRFCHVANKPPYVRFKAQLVGKTYRAKVRAISPAGNGSWSQPMIFYIRDSDKEKGQILVVGVSVGCAIIVVFMFAIILYYALFQRNIERGVPGVLYASVNPEYLNSSEVYIPDEWELNREKIELLQEIGQGSFGMVYEGIAHDINGVLECRVAVKTVNENATIRDRIQFLQEASIMKAFRSNHVTKLIGVVSQGQPTFVVMELMGGDLQSFLRNRRPEDHPSLLPLTRQEVIQMAAQIADGMAYLSARKYVHRDLAARNCFVANDRTVKIGDFGLARDIYELDYYRKGGKGLLPVRWMAPESLKDGIFTTSSDVWSFGVVIWEIVTYALQPYQGKSNEELLHYVSKGGCLRYPDECDELLRKLMDLSWQHDPKLRPSFLEIVRMLEEHVSHDFFMCSFYHEMKRKALEDTMCQEGNLHELLGRPNSSKLKKRGKLRSKNCGSVSSVDSGAYIENCKPEADQTPELGTRKSLLNDESNKGLHFDKDGGFDTNDPLLSHSAVQFSREDSMYDNCDSDINMTYGDTPVFDNHHNTSSDEGSGDLKISKIFFGKPVPV